MSASKYPPQVQRMIDNEGIYIMGATVEEDIGARVVVVSQRGVLRAMSVDQVLSPEGFADTVQIIHGPLK